MKVKFLATLALTLSLIIPNIASAAGLTGHFTPGASGIKPAIVANIPGLVYRTSFTYYDAIALKDGAGNTLLNKDQYNGSLAIWAHKFLYTPNIERISFLGNAQYHAQLIVPISAADLETQTSSLNSTGFGDPSFFPLVLSWDFEQAQISYNLGAFLPIGDYNRDKPTSIGKGFYTLVQIVGLNYWFDKEKTWCFSGLMRFEKHFKVKDKDLRQGSDLSFEWALSKQLNKNFEIGLVGYNVFQVSDDKGFYAHDAMGRRLDKDRVHGLGFEVAYTNPEKRFQLAFSPKREFGAKGRSESWSYTATFTYMF